MKPWWLESKAPRNRQAPVTRVFITTTIALATATALAACGPFTRPDSCADGAISRLYFGMDTPAGAVTDEQWQAFVDDVMTQRFPGGFTVIDGRGQWRDGRGQLIHEPTRIVEFVHDGTPQQRAHVRAVASDYKLHFSQQAVLVTQAPSSVCF